MIYIILKNVVCNELEQLETNLEELEPTDRINLLLKFLPYVLPEVRDILHDYHEPGVWLFGRKKRNALV